MLDIYEDAKPSVSLSGFKLGERVSGIQGIVDTIVDGNKIEWAVDLIHRNSGVLLYKFKEGGCAIYCADPSLELNFNAEGLLCTIIVGAGYKGKIYGSSISAIPSRAAQKHSLTIGTA